MSWIDESDNLWIFGGSYTPVGTTYFRNDLWKLKPGQKATGGENGREVCLVFIGGRGAVTAGAQDFGRDHGLIRSPVDRNLGAGGRVAC